MEFIKIGKIVNTFGIKGQLKVDSYTDFIDERFKNGSTVYVGEEKLAFVVNKHQMHKGFLLIQFKDYEDINLVEKYKNKDIYKSTDDIKPLGNGEYYFRDLKDLDVYVNENKIGKVIEVEKGISSNYLRVLVDNKEKLVPYVKAFIKNVDLDNNKIEINSIEGLLWRLLS